MPSQLSITLHDLQFSKDYPYLITIIYNSQQVFYILHSSPPISLLSPVNLSLSTLLYYSTYNIKLF